MAVHYSREKESQQFEDLPDDNLQNPLYFDDTKGSSQQKVDVMKIISLLIQAATLFVAVIILILAIVILVKPFVIDETCSTTGALTSGKEVSNCSLTPDNMAYLISKIPRLPVDQITSAIANISKAYNFAQLPDDVAQRVFVMINKSKDIDAQNTMLTSLSQLLQITNDMSTSLTYVSGLADGQAVTALNQSDMLNSLMQAYENASLILTDMVGTLTNLQTTTTATAGSVNDVRLITEDILQLTNQTYYLNYVNTVSCSDILRLHPNSSSGYYHINSRTVYCNMEELCGVGGGWTRIADFDMSDVTQSCPSGFRTYAASGVRSCGRVIPNYGNCARSLLFPTNGIGYTEICGRLTGYQHGSTDASLAGHGQTNNINSYYIDGVSLTRGSPREHVWTFISGLKDSSPAASNCPCNTPPPAGGSQNLGAFINGNYFCESGNPNSYWTRTTFYTADPLWDGQGCGSQETVCCAAAGLPWFHRQWNTTSYESLEMRVCGTEGTNTEDVSIGYYEIYIK